ncbi:hypothetical protein B0J17DRAFT_768207 [Rhizoctonia solani]|nr:hypothetical protein B0J17DRAFT_768207 [Rhizoctonia solani]
MLLSAKILRSLIDGDMSHNELHDRWAGEIEAAVWVFLTRHPTSLVAHDLRGDWLEAVYSYPELWSSNSDLALIPLLNIIAANHYQLAAFTLIDCMCDMVFGLLQVEYDTTVGPRTSDCLVHEWAQCFPIEFQLLLADTNACRDKQPRARDWRATEQQLVTWEVQPPRAGKLATYVVILFIPGCMRVKVGRSANLAVREAGVTGYQNREEARTARCERSVLCSVYHGRNMCTRRETSEDSAEQALG